jgi:cyclic beta-1,2-glucan synthetase
MMARQTWSFFDTFVTSRHNMLPPDNFQEVPNAVVANRTSPTNIGLYLLSLVAAREFGWIGSFDSMERLEATFATLEKLERYRGHLYNWYDTHDLRPLDPKYISTVDSGNLAGHLVAIEVACRGWTARPVPPAACLDGIEDTLGHLQRVAGALNDDRRNYGISPRQLDAAVETFRTVLRGARSRPGEMAENLAALRISAGNVGDIVQALTDERGDGENAPLLKWSEMLLAGIASHARDAGAGDDGWRELGMRAMVASDIRKHLSEAIRSLDPRGEMPGNASC